VARFRVLSERLLGRAGESGTAAIEFALFLPFLLLLLTGVVELGFSAYEAMQVSNAVEAGALYAAANTATFSAANTATATTSGAALPPGLNSLTATPAPSTFCGCPSAAGTVSNQGAPAPLCATTFPTACSGGVAGTYVRVNASLNHKAILPTSWGLPTAFTATAVIRTN
jgi:Flp pilus assembly protein TadG